MAGLDYANARVRGIQGRLLGPDGVRELLAQPGVAARIEYLKKSDYGEALTAHLAKEADPLRGAELGLRKQLADDLIRVDRFLGGERVRSLLRAVLAFEDGWALKTILRGVSQGEPADRILLLVAPTPGLDDSALRELACQRDVKGVVDLLATWGSPFAAPLTNAYDRYLPQRELFSLEMALDGFLFTRALETARRGGSQGRTLARFLERQIDLANAGTLLKLAGGLAADEFFIPGGRSLGPKLFRWLSRLGERELRDALARRLHLDPRLAALGERPDPFTIDEILHESMARDIRREARTHPLSIAVPLAFVLARRAEVRQIRLVLRGAEFGLPADELVSLVER
jgi:V/A-type H+-transporting ATPase subunit C